MDQLTESHFRDWMDRYKDAWESRNPEEAVDLFTTDASYHETPFDEPYRGSKRIMEFWEDVPIFQTNIHFDFEVLFVKELTGYAHCHGRFEKVASGKEEEMDGIFSVTFDESGKCSEFREWWHRRNDLAPNDV